MGALYSLFARLGGRNECEDSNEETSDDSATLRDGERRRGEVLGSALRVSERAKRLQTMSAEVPSLFVSQKDSPPEANGKSSKSGRKGGRKKSKRQKKSASRQLSPLTAFAAPTESRELNSPEVSTTHISTSSRSKKRRSKKANRNPPQESASADGSSLTRSVASSAMSSAFRRTSMAGELDDRWGSPPEEVPVGKPNHRIYRFGDCYINESSISGIAVQAGASSSDLEEERKPEVQNWFEQSSKNDLNKPDPVTDETVSISEEQMKKFENDYTKAEDSFKNEPYYDELITDKDRLNELLSNSTKYKRCLVKIQSSQLSVAKVLDPDSKISEIRLDGRSKCGQTYMDDEVVVEILPGSRQNDVARASGMPGSAGCMREVGAVYGKVVGLLKRANEAKNRVLFCTLNRHKSYLARPLCKTVPTVHLLNDVVRNTYKSNIPQNLVEIKRISPSGFLQHKEIFHVDPANRDGYVFKVVLLTWRKQKVYPLGAVVAVHLCSSEYKGGVERLCWQHKVPKRYPQDVVTETQRLQDQSRANLQAEKENREDLTDRRAFTIDPPGSKDLDDALSVWKEGDCYVVGVHIADVAAVVPKDSTVDLEARKRAVTFYPHIHTSRCMLPEPLSHDECSLLEGMERRAISVFFTLNENGEKKAEPYVRRTIIKSQRQMTYEEAENVIGGSSTTGVDSALAENVKQLHEVASKLRAARKKASVYFVPFEDPRLHSFDVSRSPEAHALVEEFMILANTYIAERLTPKYRELMILRCHEAPTGEKLAEWQEAEGGVVNLVMQLQSRQVSADKQLSVETATELASSEGQNVIVQKGIWQTLCRCLEDGDWEAARRLVCMDDLHPLQCLASSHWMELMESAEYRCYSDKRPSKQRHFDLGLYYYTHFTSPIRRYVDLHVHRLLHADLDGQTPSCTPDDVTRLCQLINSATARQKAFEKGCLAMKIAHSLQRQPLVFRTFVDQVDSEQLTLVVPSLRAVPDRKQKLTFSVLGVSSQPQLQSNVERSTVTVKMKKRVYNEEGFCPGNFMVRRTLAERMPDRGVIIVDVDPSQPSVEILPEDWQKTLQASLGNQEQPWENIPQPARENTHSHISSERGDRTVFPMPCHFRMQFTPGQIISLQMSADCTRGLMTAQVEVLHVAHNASICTKHVRDPLSSFCTQAYRSTREEEFFTCKDYVHAWVPLLEMEAAFRTRISESIMVENVSIILNTKDDVVTGTLSLGSKFCFDRGIDFSGMMPEDAEEDDKTGNRSQVPLNYLCFRYTTACPEPVVSKVTASPVPAAFDKKYTWVAHASTVSVIHKGGSREDPEGGRLYVKFRLTGAMPAPPRKLLRSEGGDKVLLEILSKSEVERRAQQMLLEQIEGENCQLARAIAVSGERVPVLDSDRLRFGSNKANWEVHVKNVSRELPRNNEEQEEAIKMALTNTLSLIQGPPGTGKTYTAIKLVYLFCKINRQLEAEGKGKKTVLFCGPSNKSVDLVASLLQKTLGDKCPKMVRMYGSAIESKDYPTPIGNLRSRGSKRDLQSDPKLASCSLHNIIRESEKPHAEKIAEFEKVFETVRSNPGINTIESAIIKSYQKLLFQASVEELGNYEVVLTTCAIGGTQRLVQGLKEIVHQVIIDECAMSPEPHSLVPIIATKAQQVVLIGDHKQLRPVITCPAAAELGLDQSLFERLYKEPVKAPRVCLRLQYRMHPEICQFPSDEFYDSQLVTAFSSLWEGQPLPLWPDDPRVRFRHKVPHLLIDVFGLEESLSVTTEEGNEKSKSNEAEAEKVTQIVTFLRSIYKIKLNQIKVLTQYNAQRNLIEDKLKARCEDRSQGVFSREDDIVKHQTVSTVVSSQGGEWDYVILSTVRSLPSYKIEPHPTDGWCRRKLGFITDCNQVNVALTRARRGLIIVGNAELLKCDAVWGRLVERYQKLGCVRKAAEFPPSTR